MAAVLGNGPKVLVIGSIYTRQMVRTDLYPKKCESRSWVGI